MKVLVETKDSLLVNVSLTVFFTAVSGAFLWWTWWIQHDWMNTVVCALFSSICLAFCISELIKDTCRQRRSILGIRGDCLYWSVSECSADSQKQRKEIGKSIPLTAIKTLKVIIGKNGEGAADFSNAQVSITDISGKNHPLPESLMPGIYYKKILDGLRERIPAIALQEKFTSS
jgi:hypothetical protein